MAKTWNALTDALVTWLQKETYVLTATIHEERNTPYLHTVSWVYAIDDKTIRIAIDAESQIIKNLKKNSHLTMSVIGEDSTYAVEGEGFIRTEEIEGLPVKLSLVECRIHLVEDIMFDGAKITTYPQFEKTYDIEAAAKLDKLVIEALKSYQ